MRSQTRSDSAERTPRSSSGKQKQTAHKAKPEKAALPKPKRAKKKKAGKTASSQERYAATQEVECLIGHRFSDAELLLQALTHRSYSQEVSPPEPDNERLEFLGDAVLQLIVTKRLWSELADASEGDLTRRRAEKVSGRALAKVSRRLGLSDFLRLGKGELKTGGSQKPSILAGAFEALVGALYIDSGYGVCAELVESWLWAEENSSKIEAETDYKSRLQEELQRRGKRLPIYRVVNETGPEHEKIFEIEVRHSQKVLGRGAGKNKKEAEQAAAKESLMTLEPSNSDN